MERKIGEIFEYGGEWDQCVELPSDYIGCICNICSMNFDGKCPLPIRECQAENGRSDRKDVIFKKLEKVGEPYEHCGKLYQCYKQPMEIEIRLLPDNCYPVGKDNLVEIEIKQTKEEMEQKTNLPKENNALTRVVYNYVNGKISDKELIKTIKEMPDEYPYTRNLKEFDLGAAKAGKPICTRDGRKARIVCFDRISGDDYYKIVACVTAFDGDFEEVIVYGIDGYIVDSQNPKDEDLMMLPEKKEGWVNVYDADTTFTYAEGIIYNTKEEALAHAKSDCILIGTGKISWEE